MLRTCAVVGLLAVVVSPVSAATKYDFTIDPAKSSFAVSYSFIKSGSPVSGKFSLMLDAPSGNVGTRNWNVGTSLDTVNAATTTTFNFKIPLSDIDYTIAAGDAKLMDWNANKGSIPSTALAGGPNISTGAIPTELLVSVFAHSNYYNVDSYITKNGAAGEWILMNWNVELADADWLSVAGTGDLEAHISTVYTATNGVTYTTILYGRTPEPSTLALLGAGVMFLRRRRSA